MVKIDLDKNIIKALREPVGSIMACANDIHVLKGGRSSTKSQAVAIAIIISTMIHKQSSIAIVRYNNKVKDRLVDTFSEAIRLLNVKHYWRLKKSPYKYVLLDKRGRETSISIKFVGSENPDDIKSYKPDTGSFRCVWFEEAATFKSYKDIMSVIDTMGRGVGEHTAILTYNPPKKKSNWVNKEFNADCGKAIGFESDSCIKYIEYTDENGELAQLRTLIHHSTYLDVVADGHIDWLGKLFIGNANKALQENTNFYEWNYLGKVVGTEASVFDNIVPWNNEESKLDIRTVYRGLDWGNGGPDPTVYVEWYYDEKNKYLYALDEYIYRGKMDFDNLALEIKKRDIHNFPIQGDSAVPTLNNQLVSLGVNVVQVKKLRVEGGIAWLQNLNGIFISQSKTPFIFKEFSNYEYEVDREDNVVSDLPDKGNHSIDATRYALVNKIKLGG